MKLQELKLQEQSRTAESDARGMVRVFEGIGKKLIEEYGEDATSERGQTIIDQEKASWPNTGMQTFIVNEWRLEEVEMDRDEMTVAAKLITAWTLPLLTRWLEPRFAKRVADTLDVSLDNPDDNETRIYVRFNFIAHDFLDYTEAMKDHLE